MHSLTPLLSVGRRERDTITHSITNRLQHPTGASDEAQRSRLPRVI